MKIRCAIAAALVLMLSAWAQQASVSTASQTFRVSGKVVNAITGQAPAHAEVTLSPTEQHENPQSVITDGDGNFQFDGVGRGKWALTGQGHGFARQNLDQHEEFSTAIAVGPGLQSEGLLFRLCPDASIMGTISDEQGEVIRGAQVMLFHDNLENGARKPEMYGQTTSDDRGYYRITNLVPGTYFVAVIAQPWYAQGPQQNSASSDGQTVNEGRLPLDVAYPVTLYDGVTSGNDATPLLLKAGDRVTADVTLSAVPAVHLRITGVGADPTEGYNAIIEQRLFPGVVVPLSTAYQRVGDGLEVDGLPPGQLELNLQAFGKNSWKSEQTVNVTDGAEVSAGGVRGAQVSGVVQFEGAAAPEGTYVRLVNRESGFSMDAQVGEKGAFQVGNAAAQPGTYQVMAAGISGTAVAGAQVVALTASGAKVIGHEVEISGAGPVHLNVTLSQGLGRVDGVALRDGKPQAGVMILLVPEDLENNPLSVRRDQSDSDGTFSLYRVLPGKYVVLALAQGWDMEWMKAAVLKPYVAGGVAVQVGRGGRLQVKVKVQ